MGHLEQNKLFTPSGCLTGDTLLRCGRGLLLPEEKTLADTHLKQCELCSLALEGFMVSDDNTFSEDVEWLNQHFISDDSGLEMPESERADTAESVSGFEGPRFPRLSPAQMEEFTRRIKEQAEKQEKERRAAPAGQTTTGKNGKRRFLSGKYALIAAVILVLLTVGGIQLYLSHLGKENLNPQTADQTEAETSADTQAFVPVPHQQPGEQKVEQSLKTKPIQSGKPILETVFHEMDLEIANDESIGKAAAQPETITDKKEQTIKGPAETLPVTVNSYDKEETEAFVDGISVVSSREDVSRKSIRAEAKEEAELMEADVFIVVEESPQYPGGDEAWQKFLVENLTYPQAAREASIQGTVYVTFIVEKDGSITEPAVSRGIGAGCDEEVLRVVRQMPRWTPGKQRGKAVRVRVSIPVKFTLAG